ncbi:dentin sialophosphoprotein-like [Odontomachus brunneus]|uniref:dentin sialophosphoprotein-like n=1 Tax=Odontomachus brunneus TaxID=486640 RepID=UPI0013F1DE9A|nr:dentin sialophosphoprotein-like [Odontomachus brunneus]XP_032664151.1 dentin sialophosphoprotein-like [Odontomachus brunneus]XP_032664152.1 dentin sialophosphoprotein-like [Odontomachus brunneus]XP_032664153.1 dentin sialophosphoprotein-like [Odontomachus brunneus]
MPGIHVHTFSQLDWIDQEKESLLTVPGSYWLCNKKNIYKFIFKYHRTTKNSTQFLYGKELLKIIRRIIKCHPSQGQQFGTQHLLVTYNCTSWTRQDKMFAILKFQQRTSAAAFSHAFVLTIKICSSSEEKSLYDLKYPIVKEVNAGAELKDSSDTADNDEKDAKTVIHTIDKVSSRKLRTCPSRRINQILKHSENMLNETSEASVNSTLQNNIMEKSAKREKPDGRTKNATTCTVTKEDLTDKYNTELHDSMCVNKLTNGNSRRPEKETKLNPAAHRQDQLKTAKRKNETQEVEEIDGKNKKTKLAEIQRQHQEAPKTLKYQISFSSKPSSTKIIKDDYNVDKRLLNKSSSDEDSVRHDVADDKNNSTDNDNIGESIVDSSKVTNRYLIKKDINNAGQYRTSARSASAPPVVDKSMQGNSQQDTSEANNANENFASKVVDEKANEESTQRKQHDEIDKSSDKRLAPISTRVVDDSAQSSTYSKSCRARKQRSREFFERRTVADDKVLRSSNITDLVMEGLMFTIRQDRDSVAVIEQKTKLEVDEVLENSEKVETEAGEKCLLNSSLLRLENLITMIDPPRDKDEQHRANHSMIGNSTHPSPPNVSNTACHLNNIDYVDEATSKLSIPNYERCSLMDQSSSPRFGWQQQRTCSIGTNNGNYSANRSTEKLDQSVDWVDDHERDEEYMQQNDIEMINEEERKYIEEVEDEEEDIIPEVFRSTIFSETNANPPNTELLMDDMDIEDIGKFDASMKNHDNSPPTFCHSLSSNKVPTSETLLTSEKTRPTSVPRVISNKVITVEQIPLALQKILRHTRAFSLAKAAYKTPIAHNDKEETQSTTSTESAASETNAPSSSGEFHGQQQHSDITNNESHSTDKNLMEKREQSMKSENDDHKRDKECTKSMKNASLQRSRDIDPSIANESAIEVTDTDKTRNKDKEMKTRNEDEETKTRDEDKETKTRNEDKETKTRNEDKETKTRNEDKKTKTKNEHKSRVMIDLEDIAESRNSDAKEAMKEKKNEIRRSSRTKTRTRRNSPRKLQDITDEFYYDLMMHKKDDAIHQRCLRQRHRTLNSSKDIKNNKVRIEMLKFIQDMIGDVKVVVRRLNINNRPSLLKKKK